jgi:hypothetical protein
MRSAILLAFSALFALSLPVPAGADEPLRVAAAALGPDGVLTRQTADVMGHDGPSLTPLLVIEEPALRGASRISGRVEAFEVESEAWLEVAAVFADGRREVARTLDAGGSGSRLRGTLERRRFELPVPFDGVGPRPVRLELGVGMVGPGVVSVSELRLEARPAQAGAGGALARGVWPALAALAAVALGGSWMRRSVRHRRVSA